MKPLLPHKSRSRLFRMVLSLSLLIAGAGACSTEGESAASPWRMAEDLGVRTDASAPDADGGADAGAVCEEPPQLAAEVFHAPCIPSPQPVCFDDVAYRCSPREAQGKLIPFQQVAPDCCDVAHPDLALFDVEAELLGIKTPEGVSVEQMRPVPHCGDDHQIYWTWRVSFLMRNLGNAAARPKCRVHVLPAIHLPEAGTRCNDQSGLGPWEEMIELPIARGPGTVPDELHPGAEHQVDVQLEVEQPLCDPTGMNVTCWVPEAPDGLMPGEPPAFRRICDRTFVCNDETQMWEETDDLCDGANTVIFHRLKSGFLKEE